MHAYAQRSAEKIFRSPRRQNEDITRFGATRIFINGRVLTKLGALTNVSEDQLQPTAAGMRLAHQPKRPTPRF